MAFDRLVREGNAACQMCGMCLTQCPYLDIGRDEAMEQMRLLRSGLVSKEIENRCISCYSCETYCPNGGHPYLAIQSVRRDRYRREGVPENILFMLSSSKRNFRNRALRYMRSEDRRLLTMWKDNAGEDQFDEVLFPGCNLLTTPALADSAVLNGVTIAGSFDQCCGEMYFRLGMIDEAKATAQKLEAFYAAKKIGRMLFVCPACYHMFSRVMPLLFGVRFDFEKVYFAEWMLQRIETGQFEVKRPLDADYSIHDSCHARVMGETFTDKVRTLVEVLGGRVVSSNGNGSQDGFCCGIAAGAKSHSVIDVVRVARRAMQAQAKNPGSRTVAYCTGCALTLTLTGLVIPRAIDVRHLIHLAARAGDLPEPASMRSLARPAVRAILRDGTPTLLSRKRGHVKISSEIK